MIPEPSKLPITHPITSLGLEAFVHPRCRVFGEVVRDPATGIVMVANGIVALRITRGPIIFDTELPAPCEKFRERFDSLPWPSLEPPPAPDPEEAKKYFGKPVETDLPRFDDVRGKIYRKSMGLEPLWLPGTGGGAAGSVIHMTREKPVCINAGLRIPLAFVQLVARLPKCQISTRTPAEFLSIYFNGGDGIIANRYAKIPEGKQPKTCFHLFRERLNPDRLGGGFMGKRS